MAITTCCVSCDRDGLTCALTFIATSRVLNHLPYHVSLAEPPQVHRGHPSSKQVKACSQTSTTQHHTWRLCPQTAQPSIEGPPITCQSFMPFPANISHLVLPRALERVYSNLGLLWLLMMPMISLKLWTSHVFQSMTTRPARVWGGA